MIQSLSIFNKLEGKKVNPVTLFLGKFLGQALFQALECLSSENSELSQQGKRGCTHMCTGTRQTLPLFTPESPQDMYSSNNRYRYYFSRLALKLQKVP